jgi:hypothetical protein
MADKTKNAPIKIELTPEQREQIKLATGLDVSTLELTPEVLEERVAPKVEGMKVEIHG